MTTKPIPLRLACPACGELHIDEGEFATKPHHTHACQECGAVWRPAVVPTVGVRFLPGFKNEPKSTLDDLRAQIAALGEEERRELLGCLIPRLLRRTEFWARCHEALTDAGVGDMLQPLDHRIGLLLTRLTEAETANRDGFELSHAALDAAGVPAAASHLERVRLLIARVTEAEAARDAWKRAAGRMRSQLSDVLGLDPDIGADRLLEHVRRLADEDSEALAAERSKRAEAEARAKELEAKPQQEPLTEDQYRRFPANERNATGEWKRRAIEAESALTSERALREGAEVALATARGELNQASNGELLQSTYADEYQHCLADIAEALGLKEWKAADLPSKVAEVARERDNWKKRHDYFTARVETLHKVEAELADTKQCLADAWDSANAERNARVAAERDRDSAIQQRDELERRVKAWEPVIEAAVVLEEYWTRMVVPLSGAASRLQDHVRARPTPKPLAEGKVADGS